MCKSKLLILGILSGLLFISGAASAEEKECKIILQPADCLRAASGEWSGMVSIMREDGSAGASKPVWAGRPETIIMTCPGPNDKFMLYLTMQKQKSAVGTTAVQTPVSKGFKYSHGILGPGSFSAGEKHVAVPTDFDVTGNDFDERGCPK